MSDTRDLWARLVANGKSERWKRPHPARKAPKRKPSAKPGAAERDVLKLLQDAAALMGVTLLRNHVGCIQDKFGRYHTFGLGVGSPDLVGWESVVIGPEHIGQTFARFVGVECKREIGGETSGRQSDYITRLLQAGARAGVARSVEDLQRILSNNRVLRPSGSPRREGDE